MNEMEKEDRKKIDVYCQKIIKDTIEKNHTLYKGTIMIYNTQDIMKCTIRSNCSIINCENKAYDSVMKGAHYEQTRFNTAD